MNRYTYQAPRCVCDVHRDPHKEHAKHFVAHRGHSKCAHWNVWDDVRFLTVRERERERLERRREQKRRSLRPTRVIPIAA